MRPGGLQISKYLRYVSETHFQNLRTVYHGRNTLQFLSGLFGGATSQEARGAWVSSSAGLVVESVTICYAFCSLSQKMRCRRAVVAYCKDLAKDMKQEAISLEIDGRLFFIS